MWIGKQNIADERPTAGVCDEHRVAIQVHGISLMGFRTAGIEKPIIIQIDGETHACSTIHKIFTRAVSYTHLYFDDMYVDSGLQFDTLSRVGRSHYWTTNEFEHDGVHGSVVFKHCLLYTSSPSIIFSIRRFVADGAIIALP